MAGIPCVLCMPLVSAILNFVSIHSDKCTNPMTEMMPATIPMHIAPTGVTYKSTAEPMAIPPLRQHCCTCAILNLLCVATRDSTNAVIVDPHRANKVLMTALSRK